MPPTSFIWPCVWPSELVLPADKQVPFILDDTLTNFDEARCAAALDFLCAEAARRQILLFTCQSREAVYLQNRKNVHIITLRETGWRLMETATLRRPG